MLPERVRQRHHVAELPDRAAHLGERRVGGVLGPPQLLVVALHRCELELEARMGQRLGDAVVEIRRQP